MRLSDHDASFLYTETASGPMHGVGIAVLNGPATYAELYDYYAARIHLVPRLRQKLAFVPYNLAHPVWVDEVNFKLDNHFKSHVVPDGTTLEQAIDVALELGEKPLDRSRPLWLNYVIENVEGKTLLISMAHHAFVDGATAVAMGIALTDPSPDAPPPEPPSQPWQPVAAPAPMQLWAEAAGELASRNVSAMLHPERSRPDLELQRKVNEMMAGDPTKLVMEAPWNAAPVGPKRQVAWITYTLAEIKSIRKVLGGTINDVAVAVVTEAAARYLTEHNEQVQNRYLRLMCPVNVRHEDDDPLAGGGNRVSALYPVLPAWQMDITERLAAVCEELNGLKAAGAAELLEKFQTDAPSVPPIAAGATVNLIGSAFDLTAAAAANPLPVRRHVGPRPVHTGFNFTLTNVPGVPHAQYVAGYEVTHSIGTLMLGGTLGFGAGVGSYNGDLMFGFTAEPRLMPDVGRMRDLVGEVFEELRAAAIKAGADPAEVQQPPAADASAAS